MWASPAAGSLGIFQKDAAITPVTFTANDTDTPVSYLTAQENLPPGVELVDNSLTGTPGFGGVYTFTVTAFDSLNAESSRTFSMDINSAPEITSALPELSAKEGILWSYDITMDDAEGDTVTLTADPKPSWLTLANGTLSGTPAASDAGGNPVTITASDGRGGSVTQSFSITVAGNESPAWASPAAGSLGTVLKDAAITPVTFTANDVDVPVTYTTTAGTLPTGLSLSTAGSLSGTPTASGTFNFTVSAADHLGASSDRAFSMVVQDITPDAFTFAPTSGVATATLQTSNEVTIAGITGNVAISIAGGSYRIDNGSYTAASGKIGRAHV